MKKVLITLFIIFISTSLLGCNSFPNPNSDFCVAGNEDGVYICEKRLTSYFDTAISLKLYVTEEDDYDIQSIFDDFQDITALYHQYFDKYNEYENINNVYTINNSDSEVEIDDVLFNAIKYALDNEDIIIYNEKPLFNIALGPVLEVWHNARESDSCDTTREFGISYCPVPNDELENGVFNIDPNDIILDEENRTISFAKTNMSIDLGGFAKGYVSNVIAEYLNNLNITYLLNNGNSNIIANGINPNNEDGNYYIALTRPSTDFSVGSDYYIYLTVPEDLSIVTSGNYQRFFKGIDDEVVYHHIIDPNTLYPGGYCMSVTVIYPDSSLADLLSTAIYLLPIDDAKAFVESYPNLEAIWYFEDGTYEYSTGFSNYILEI